MSATRITGAIDALLRPCGFVRRGRTWNKRTNSLVDVIHLQTSKSGDAVTINIGVLDPDVYQICWREPAPAFVPEDSCTIRIRVGRLLNGRDLWWPLDRETAPGDIVEKITAYALPFLEQMHSRAAMEDFLSAELHGKRYPDYAAAIYLAIVKARRGDLARACADLSELRARGVEAWESRIDAVAQDLGCQHVRRATVGGEPRVNRPPSG